MKQMSTTVDNPRNRFARAGVWCAALCTLMITVSAARATCEPVSDVFTNATLQAFWRVLDPLSNATVDVTGTQVELSVSAGEPHNLWSGAQNTAPRILQATSNENFGVEVKFDSMPTTPFQMQGLIVQEDDDTFLRVDTHHNGSGLRVFVAFIDGGETVFHNAAPSVGVIPYRLRIERDGNQWTVSYSQDGVTWVSIPSFTQAMTVTESGLFVGNFHGTPASAPAFTARAALFNNLACPLVDESAVPPPVGPVIDIWYGDTQSFGDLGNPQNWINIPGRVTGTNAITSLTYSVNAEAPVSLAIGPNATRLAALGDFVTEIDYAGLSAGANTVEFSAADAGGHTTSVTVNVNYTPSEVWPLPYTADWSSSTNIQDVGKVVDGWWEITADGVRTMEPGYDRLIVLGDETWETNYEVVMPMTVHAANNDAGVGFAVGWQGHTGATSPRVNWPLQSISWIRFPLNNPRLRVITYPYTVLADEAYPAFQANTPYLLKSRSISIGGGQSRVSVKIWPEADPEPAGWMIEQDVTSRDGSVLIICHKADVTVGNVSITPLNPADFPAFAGAPSQSAIENEAYAYDITVNGGDGPVTISAPTLPDWLSFTDHGDGTATLEGMPDALDAGIHWVTLHAEDTADNTVIQSFWILVSPASTTCLPISDNFAGDDAPKPFWRFLDPAGDGSLVVAGDQAAISVPAGTGHDFWSTGIDVPRLLQATPAGDFHVEVKFDSTPSAQFQMQGIIVQATDDHALRFETFHNGSQMVLFVADVAVGGLASVKHNASTLLTPQYLQVQREGDDWTFRVSEDGVAWHDVHTFTENFPATEIGFYAGNASPNPAFTAVADYVMNVDCPEFAVPCEYTESFVLDWSQYPELNPGPGQVYPHATTITNVDGSSVDVTVTVIRPARDANQVNVPGTTDFPGTIDAYTPSAETYRYWRPDDDEIDTLIFTFSEPVYLDQFMFGGQRPVTTAHRAYAEISFWDGPDGTGNKVVSALPDPGGIAFINTGDPLAAAINVLQDRGLQSSFLSTDGTYAMASRDPNYPPRPWTALKMGGAKVRSFTWSMYVSAIDVSPDGDNTLDLDTPRTQTEPTGAVSGYIGGFDFEVCVDAPPLLGAIGDYVWHDLNRDGIQDAGEPGVDDVLVTLYDDQTNALETVWTHSGGAYLFTNLAAGDYTVGFDLPPGYVFTDSFQGGDPALDSNADPVTGLSDPITLAAGETNLTVDAGLFLYHADIEVNKEVDPLKVGRKKWNIPISKGEQFVSGDYWLRLEYDEPSFDVWGPGNLKSGVNLDENWHHVVGRFTQGEHAWGSHTMEILVDGVVVATKVANGTPVPSSAALFLGSYLGDRHYFDGYMDEVRFSQIARNDAWLQATHESIMNPDTFVTVGSEDPGTQPGFAFQRTLTVSGAMVVEPLTNFPVLVNVTEAFLIDEVLSATGEDLLFTDADGNPLPHEIELFHQPAGRLVAWVNTPLVQAGGPTELLLHYGNSSPPAATFPPSSVWDDDFVMVHHLNETFGNVFDSTVYGNDGVVNGATPTIFGIANGAYHFNGIDNEIEIPDDLSLHLNTGDFTIEGWYARRAGPAEGRFTITVENHGPDPALNVVVNENLDPDFTLVKAEATQGLFTQPPGIWNVGDLPPGGSATLWLDIIKNTDQDLTNTVSASSDSYDPDLDNNVASVVVGDLEYVVVQPWMKPDFIVTDIVLQPQPGVVGDVFDAHVTIENKGDIPGDAGSLQVFLHASASQSPGAVGDDAKAAGTLNVNQTKTLVFTGLTAPATAGTYHFRAFVNADHDTDEKSFGNNQKSVTYAVNPVAAPDPDPGPGPDPDPDPDPAPAGWMKPDFIVIEIVLDPVPGVKGDTFSAQVTVLNKGDIPGDGGLLRVWESKLPPGLLNDPDWDAELPVGVLAVNESKTLTFNDLTATSDAGWHHFLAFVNARGAVDSDEKSFGNNHKSRVYMTYDLKLSINPTHPDGVELTWYTHWAHWGSTYAVFRKGFSDPDYIKIGTGIAPASPANTWIDTNPPPGGALYHVDIE